MIKAKKVTITEDAARGRERGSGVGFLSKLKLRGGFGDEVQASREADRMRDQTMKIELGAYSCVTEAGVGDRTPSMHPEKRRSKPHAHMRRREAQNWGRAKQRPQKPEPRRQAARDEQNNGGCGWGRGKPLTNLQQQRKGSRHNQGRGSGRKPRRRMSDPTGECQTNTTTTTTTLKTTRATQNLSGQPNAADRGRGTSKRPQKERVVERNEGRCAGQKARRRLSDPTGYLKTAVEPPDSAPVRPPQLRLLRETSDPVVSPSATTTLSQESRAGQTNSGRQSTPLRVDRSAEGGPGQKQERRRDSNNRVGNAARQRSEPTKPLLRQWPHFTDAALDRAGDAISANRPVGGSASRGTTRRSSATSVDAALAFARRASVSEAERSLLAHQSSMADASVSAAAAMTALVAAKQEDKKASLGGKAWKDTRARNGKTVSRGESMQPLLLCESDSESETMNSSINLGDMLCVHPGWTTTNRAGASHSRHTSPASDQDDNLHDSCSTAISTESHVSLILTELALSPSTDGSSATTNTTKSQEGSKSSWEHFSQDSNFARLQQQQNQEGGLNQGGPQPNHQPGQRRRSWGPLSGFDSKSMLWVNFEDEELLGDLSDDDVDGHKPGPKGVIFAPAHTNSVFTHIGRWEMDEDICRRVWYDANDFDEIRMELIRTVLAMRRIAAIREEEEEVMAKDEGDDDNENDGGTFSNNGRDECGRQDRTKNDCTVDGVSGDQDKSESASSPCTRGLEHMTTPESNEAREVSIRNAVRAVLLAQDDFLLAAAKLFEERESSSSPSEQWQPSIDVQASREEEKAAASATHRTTLSLDEVRAVEEEIAQSLAQISTRMTEGARAEAEKMGMRDAEEVASAARAD